MAETLKQSDVNKLIKVDKLIDEVIRRGATDLHIVASKPPMLRIDGSLVPSEGSAAVLNTAEAQELSLSLLSAEQKETFHTQKDVDFSFSFKDQARFRANVYEQMSKISAELRFLPTHIRTIEDLNLPPVLHQFTQVSQGFFLVVGPSGHGKSTALAAMLDEINHTKQDHILTIEDPIEYMFIQDKCIVDQREVGIDVNDFHGGLRSMFRQDVDVCMIGEMRDAETVSTAITAAETGHLIFSTLHTNTAAQTIDRIIDIFPPYQQAQIRSQLASTLLGVLSRRLIPSIGGGLINAVELLIANSAVRNLIREGKVHQIDMVIETSSEEGMISLNRSLADLVQRKIISRENAETFSTNPSELNMLLRK